MRGSPLFDSPLLYLGTWYPWYAWRPVKVEGRWVWLKRIERQIHCSVGETPGYLTLYRFTP